MDLLSLALEAAPKALAYAAVILAVGACSARLLARRALAGAALAPGTSTDEALATTERALSRLSSRAALALVAALLLRALAHTVVSFGVADAFHWDSLEVIAWESRWGSSWQRQVAGALVLSAITWPAGTSPRVGWTFAGAGAAAMCYLMPLLGHAAGEPSRVLLHGTHILGGGIWLGTLTASVLATRRDAPSRAAVLRAFSPVAFTGSAAIGATGLLAAWWYLGGPVNLVSTTYGRLLLLKLVLVTDAATLGFLNWRSLRGTGAGPARAERRALVVAEVAVAVAIVVVTAVLTEVEHP